MKINFNDYIKMRQSSGIKTELLSRALGAKKGLRILDATAGLGRDSFILATLGYKVVALERNIRLFKLLMDAKEKALNHPKLQEHCKNLDFLNLDFLNFKDTEKFDAIYLDPMFPEKKKSALPGKEIQFLQTLLGEEVINDQDLLDHALKQKAKRVVIKRPLRAKELVPKPSVQFKGKAVRFDVYVNVF